MKPLMPLFDRLRGPASTAATPVAFGRTAAGDLGRHLSGVGRQPADHECIRRHVARTTRLAGYPQLRLTVRPRLLPGSAMTRHLAQIWRETLREVWATNKAQVADLGLKHGAGDGNRTRALSLGITGPVGQETGPDLLERMIWSGAAWLVAAPD
ncbi:hypothetical protein [Streptomyces malaysiensis]|uniref:hypothetical protein n=1 Tax=Streptomyces malaysiensis TaxID=92644 RepID=UPI0032207635|nr:hypothetical protein [Streptomyces malaysiensis]